MSSAQQKPFYEVTLRRSGKTLRVDRDASLVQALRDVDVFVPVGCAQGICGICRTTVIEGIPDHHNSCLTSEERRANNTLLVCCDGCISETLTLDL